MKMHTAKSLRRTLSFSILWIHLAILAAALFISFFVLLQISRDQTIKEGQNSLEYMAYQMNNLTDNLTDIRNLLMQDKSIREYLSSSRSDDAEDINLQRSVMSLLYQMVKSYNYINSITLFQDAGSILSVGENNQIQEQEEIPLPVEKNAAFQELTASSGVVWGGTYQDTEMFPLRYRINQSSQTVVSLLIPLVNIWSEQPLSVLSVNIPLSYFDFLYSKNADLGAAVYLYDEQGVQLISVTKEAGAKAGNEEQPRLPLNQNGAPVVSQDTLQNTLITSKLSSVGWYLAEEIPFTALIRDMLPLQITVGFLFLISIAIAVLLSAGASRKLLNPFHEITQQMDSIGSGDLGRRLPIMEYTELNGLRNRFNNMMERIQKLVEANQRYEEEKRRLEVESLQSQINPHFLYNSLTTIRWMASMARAENVCQALLALNNVLRPIFSQPDIFWSLETERVFVQNFVDIMDYRFGCKTLCQYDIPENLKNIPALRFILQPIVENSLLHGLHSSVSTGFIGKICIRAEKTGKFLDIWVEDNGQGIKPEEVDVLNQQLQAGVKSSISKEGRTSIGLTNVNRRILLQYGKGSGLWIQSRVGEGTAVRIRISSEKAD